MTTQNTTDIIIHNVEHGFCGSIVTPNKKLVLIDCGYNNSTGWRPSAQFAGQEIECFVISNFDNDHLNDFVNLDEKCRIKSYLSNWGFSTARLYEIKGADNVTQHVAAASTAAQSANPMLHPTQTYYSDYGGFSLNCFWNTPSNELDDTNNLSVSSVLAFGPNKVLMGGDLEQKGWAELLRRSDFVHAIQNTTILIASHHGRENGFYEPLFDFIRPQIVIFFDNSIQHNTQLTAGDYAKKATGIDYSGNKRTVFTTRNDGNIYLTLGTTSGNITCAH